MASRWWVLWLLGTMLLPASSSAHFALAPKIEVEPQRLEMPQKILLRLGDVQATRSDFSDYLERITAFDTKYDRVQPNFFAHFELIRGLALFHPVNVHKYIDKLALVKNRPDFHQYAVAAWFLEQAEIFARILYYHERAMDAGMAQEPAVKAVLDFYDAGTQTAFLEQLVVLGPMPPTLKGMTDFVQKIPYADRDQIDTGAAADTELTPPSEQQRLKQRWSTFRRDVITHTPHRRRCQTIESLAVPEHTVLVEVGGRKITLADFKAIFGAPRDDDQWNALKTVNCGRLVLFYAMADLSEQLGIVQKRGQKHRETSHKLYHAAKQIAQEIGPAVAAVPSPGTDDMTLVRELMQYPQVVRAKDTLIDKTKGLGEGDTYFVDAEYIKNVEWRLQRSLAPKHSIHF